MDTNASARSSDELGVNFLRKEFQNGTQDWTGVFSIVDFEQGSDFFQRRMTNFETVGWLYGPDTCQVHGRIHFREANQKGRVVRHDIFSARQVSGHDLSAYQVLPPASNTVSISLLRF
jgi:hypothetical protein